jgi:hypothetical protein
MAQMNLEYRNSHMRKNTDRMRLLPSPGKITHNFNFSIKSRQKSHLGAVRWRVSAIFPDETTLVLAVFSSLG